MCRCKKWWRSLRYFINYFSRWHEFKYVRKIIKSELWEIFFNLSLKTIFKNKFLFDYRIIIILSLVKILKLPTLKCWWRVCFKFQTPIVWWGSSFIQYCFTVLWLPNSSNHRVSPDVNVIYLLENQKFEWF